MKLHTELEKRGATCFPFEFSSNSKTPESKDGFGILQFAKELKGFILKNNLL